jgi:hypothetical protein
VPALIAQRAMSQLQASKPMVAHGRHAQAFLTALAQDAVRYFEPRTDFGQARKRLGLEQIFKRNENAALSDASRRFHRRRAAGETLDHRVDDLLLQPVRGLDMAQRSRPDPRQIDGSSMQAAQFSSRRWRRAPERGAGRKNEAGSAYRAAIAE